MLDQSALIDNLRYAIDWCVYGYPNSNNNNVPPNPCDGSCSSIQDTLKGNMSQPGQNTPYGYCQDGTFMADVDLCSACYSLLPNQSYYANCKSNPKLTTLALLSM